MTINVAAVYSHCRSVHLLALRAAAGAAYTRPTAHCAAGRPAATQHRQRRRRLPQRGAADCVSHHATERAHCRGRAAWRPARGCPPRLRRGSHRGLRTDKRRAPALRPRRTMECYRRRARDGDRQPRSRAPRALERPASPHDNTHVQSTHVHAHAHDSTRIVQRTTMRPTYPRRQRANASHTAPAVPPASTQAGHTCRACVGIHASRSHMSSVRRQPRKQVKHVERASASTQAGQTCRACAGIHTSRTDMSSVRRHPRK